MPNLLTLLHRYLRGAHKAGDLPGRSEKSPLQKEAPRVKLAMGID